jgi:hypothetical protein
MKRFQFSIRDLLWLTFMAALVVAWWVSSQHEQRVLHDYDEVLAKYRQQLQEAQDVISQERETIRSLQGGVYRDIIPSR